MPTKKQVDEKKLRAKLDEWTAKIDELEAKARQSEASARARYLSQVDALRQQQVRAEAKLKELRDAADDARADLIDGIDKTWKQLEEAVGSAASKLKSAFDPDKNASKERS